MDQFDIPVALILFKRDKAVDIVKRIGKVRPKKTSRESIGNMTYGTRRV